MTKYQVAAELELPDDVPQDQYKNLVVVTKELQESQIAKIAEQAETIRLLKEDANALYVMAKLLHTGYDWSEIQLEVMNKHTDLMKKLEGKE